MATSLNCMAWSTTAASNNTADTGLPTLADSMTPTQLDDTFRGIMAAMKRHILDVGGAPAAVGGTADAITITTNQVISSGHQAAGFSIRFKAANTNTGATTVAVDGLTAVAIEQMDGTALEAGDIISGGIYDIAYNATNAGYTLLGAGSFQAANSKLTDFAALAVTDGNIAVGNGSTWVAESGATLRTSIGLGTGDSPTFTALTLTGGLTLGTDLSVANGGTGASTLSGLLRGNGTSAITGSGTINNDDWSGTDLAVANGGTGQSTAALGFQALASGVADGGFTLVGSGDDVIVRDGTDGSYGRFSLNDGVQAGLKSGIGSTKGNITWYNGTDWIGLAPDTSGFQLTIDSGSNVLWASAASDYRLKENVAPIVNAGEVLDALRPVMFKWKKMANRKERLGAGFIAHEVAEVLPFAVTGEKDAVREDGSIIEQGLDKEEMIAYLVAEAQSVRRRLENAGI